MLSSRETSLCFDLFAAPGTLTCSQQLANRTARQIARQFTCKNTLLTKKAPIIFQRTFTPKNKHHRTKDNAYFNYTSSEEKHCFHKAFKQIHITSSTWQNCSGRDCRPHRKKNIKANIYSPSLFLSAAPSSPSSKSQVMKSQSKDDIVLY